MSAALRHCGALIAARTAASQKVATNATTPLVMRSFALLAARQLQKPASSGQQSALRAWRQHGERGHKNFGHKPEPMPLFTRLWQALLGVSMMAVWIDWPR